MKFYHGSQTANITELKPHVSNHGKECVYLSMKRENTLVYLSNAIEKLYKNKGLKHEGDFYKWASYGFNKQGILVVEEYYPNATEETYKGVDGFIYCADNIEDYILQEDIPFVVTSNNIVKVTSVEYIPDVYEELLKLEERSEIIIKRYEDNTDAKTEWIKKVMIDEFNKNGDREEYIMFIKEKFPFITDGV